MDTDAHRLAEESNCNPSADLCASVSHLRLTLPYAAIADIPNCMNAETGSETGPACALAFAHAAQIQT